MTTPPGLIVRRASPADAVTVDALLRASAAEGGRLVSLTVTADEWRSLLERIDVVVLLAELNGSAVGIIVAAHGVHLWSGRDLMTVDAVHVSTTWRGRRIGRTLVNAMAALAGNGTITWQVDEGDLPAQRFSLGLGAHLRRQVVARWDRTSP